jgi:hypothetical protein
MDGATNPRDHLILIGKLGKSSECLRIVLVCGICQFAAFSESRALFEFSPVSHSLRGKSGRKATDYQEALQQPPLHPDKFIAFYLTLLMSTHFRCFTQPFVRRTPLGS